MRCMGRLGWGWGVELGDAKHANVGRGPARGRARCCCNQPALQNCKGPLGPAASTVLDGAGMLVARAYPLQQPPLITQRCRLPHPCPLQAAGGVEMDVAADGSKVKVRCRSTGPCSHCC